MGLFDKFPYTDYHQLNLDWIIKKIKRVDADLDDLQEAKEAAEAAAVSANASAVSAEAAAERLANGSPVVVTEASQMTDTNIVYLYMGSETGYTAGDWYYYDGVAWLSGGTYAEPTVTTKILNAIGSYTFTENTIGAYEVGHYWNSQNETSSLVTVSSYTAFNPIEVQEGDHYELYVRAGASARQNPLILTDDNYNILYRSERPSTTQWMTISGDIPANVKYALITCNTTNINTIELHYFNITRTELNDVSAIKDKADLLSSGMLDLKNKNVAILGDSISTNGNYSSSNPEGNVPEIVITEDDIGVTLSAFITYYDIGTVIGDHTITADDVGTELSFVPVADDVGKMVGVPLNYNSASTVPWWKHLKNLFEFNAIPVCWSGASISSHEGNRDTYKTSYAWHDAQIRKCGIRTPGSMTRTAPDVIIIYRGVNDFSHSPYTHLETDFYSDNNWSVPDTDYDQYYQFEAALSMTINKLRTAYPSARIILCTLNVFKRVHYNAFPTNNGINTLPQYNKAIRDTADFWGCDVIEFDKDGITFKNCYVDGYITDSSTNSTHPNNKGHEVMARRAIRDILKMNN